MSEEKEVQQVEGDVQEQFEQFLSQHKIDTSSLVGTKEGAQLLNAKEQRAVAILKAVTTSPLFIHVYAENRRFPK
jgi:hypothetical protein